MATGECSGRQVVCHCSSLLSAALETLQCATLTICQKVRHYHRHQRTVDATCTDHQQPLIRSLKVPESRRLIAPLA